MKCLTWVLLLWAIVPRNAQAACSSAEVEKAVSQVHSIQEQLKRIQVEEMNANVPDIARDQLTRLKDALTCVADGVIAQAEPSVDAIELQKKVVDILHVNPPEPTDNSVVSNDDHPANEALASYGQNLMVSVSRPPNVKAVLELEFSVNIPCGDDHMLIIYEPENGAWRKQLRWQAPPLKKISDAFGDFFVSATLSAPAGGDPTPRIIVAHGTPWCTSRFSGFAIDVLSPGLDPNVPKVLWHTRRGYSRGDIPTLKSSGNTFELRLNESSFDIDTYKRRVIYRYQLDEHQRIHRIEPIAIHARGFVEEWLSAPWSESEAFSVQGTGPSLELIHGQFQLQPKSDTEFVSHSNGPVRACNAPGTFQVEVRSILERIVPGKPGGESQPLPSRYFHVRETKDGYLTMSAPIKPDPACRGTDLMAPKAR